MASTVKGFGGGENVTAEVDEQELIIDQMIEAVNNTAAKESTE